MAKKCSKCKMVKPVSDFRFLHRQNRFMSECRQCESNRRKQTPSRKATRELAVSVVTKLCKRHGTGILSDAVDRLISGE